MRAAAVLLLLAGCAATAPVALTPAQRARVADLTQRWPAEPAYARPYSALAPTKAASGPVRASLYDESDDFYGLPRAPGYEEVFYTCSACHSLRIVMQQRATRARWDHMLHWMAHKQGMPMPEPAAFDQLLDYLSTHFGAEPPSDKR